MASQPDSELVFSVRIVSLDYYMAPPIPDLDFCYSSFQGRNVEEVPVIRIYGSTPAGQKTCLHIHRALPYLYIPCSEELLKNPKEGHAYVHVLSRAIEKALRHRSTSASKGQHVHGCSLVRAKKLYGFHYSEELFVKIYLYHPRDVARVATLLLDGAVLNKSFQPYESHIPYHLQFLVDYNLYGMGHIHVSKVMFRPPLPDVFIPKVAWFKKNDAQASENSASIQEGPSNDVFGSIPVWLASTIPSSLIWPFSAAGYGVLGDKVMHLLRRQSICGLEVDSSVDDIINEKYKTYTSLSQTRSDVKLVQSLVPIWEEYERSGMQEAVKSPDFSKPHPGSVLRSFSHGFEYENALLEICTLAQKSLPSKVVAVEVNERLDQYILSFLEIEKPVELVEPLRPQSQPLMCPEENENVPTSSGSFSDLDENSRTIEKVPEFQGSGSVSKKLISSERIEPGNFKDLDTEALGLLNWFASSQAAEDVDIDDELVHEVILSPLFPTKSYKKALEMAHLDYESASQQECQDILDSIEDVLKSEELKNQATDSKDSDHLGNVSSGNVIPQVDGSSDDNYTTPQRGEFSETSINRGRDRSCMYPEGKRALSDSRYRRDISVWGSLPLSIKQKDHPDLEFASHNSSLEGDMKNDSESSSSLGNQGDMRCNFLKVEADTVSFSEKEGEISSSCSVRELMRKKRFFRADQSESERHYIKEFSCMQGQKMENLIPEEPIFHPFAGSDHRMPYKPDVESPADHQVAIGQEGRSTSCGHAACSCETSGCEEEFSIQYQNLGSHFCENRLVDEEFRKKRTYLLSSLITVPDGKTSLPVADMCVAKDGESNSDRLPKMYVPVCKESYSALDTNILQSKNHGNGEWDMGASSNAQHDECTYTYREKVAADYIEMSFRWRPPSKDQIDTISKKSLGASACFQNTECHDGLTTSNSCMSSAKHGLDDLPPFFIKEFNDEKPRSFLPNEENPIIHRESVLGLPTHFQNDGSTLYLLTHALSPPTSDGVRQWLFEEALPCSVDHAAGRLKESCQPSWTTDPFLNYASEGLNSCFPGNKQIIPQNVCGNKKMNLPIRGFMGDLCHSLPDSLKSSLEVKKSPGTKNNPSCAIGNEPEVSAIRMNGKQHVTDWRDISQISGPDEKSHLTPLSQIGFRDPASVGGGQQLTLISVEVQAQSRGDIQSDPQFDAINIIALAIQEDMDHAFEIYVLVCCHDEKPSGRIVYGISGCKFVLVSEEKYLLEHFVKIISSFDPDILLGWEIQNASLGFLAERAAHLGVNLLKSISRTPAHETKFKDSSSNPEKGMMSNLLPEALIIDTALEDAIIEDEWGRLHASGIHVGGRIVLNVWRIMRAEVKLNMYTVESVAEEVLRRKVPLIPCRVLNSWFSSGPGRARFRCIEYMVDRAKLNLEIMNQMDMVNRTSELARVFGIDFFSVLSRGSQFRVESMLLRLAHTQNYLAVSPGNQQVAAQPAMECLPLVMEPESGFYADPVVVLDFQSLYPSMIIAYNLCFCTCLGKVSSRSGVLGVSSYSPDPQLLMELKEQLLLTPNGVMYVPPKVRKGVLPRLLEEILSTRIMVKKALKKLMPSQRVLQRIFNARQLALKLIANVTYGYTAAGFSGRMPCAELADSIVQCGRRTLEAAVAYVNEHETWKARVIYGDTDSMFVLLKGRTREDAFRIGNEIASAVTSMNPYPVTLKLEKVYHPCFLLTKKRYVGYGYESPDQQIPTFDAKGIETVRRDTCPAVAKTLEQSIRIIFEQQDLSKVKSYLQRQWTRILSGKVSFQDFVFAKEVRLGTYSARAASLPPAAIVATKAMRVDPRAEPQYGQRVPYVVIHGEPGARLVDMVVDPLELLEINSPYRLNDLYYITKQIIPALQRVFGLLGADLKQWFLEMPRPVRPILAKRHAYVSHPGFLHEYDDNNKASRRAQVKKSRIDTYYISRHCTLCGELVQASACLCDNCLGKGPLVVTTVVGKTSKLEKEIQHLAAICRHCGGGGDWMVESGIKCTSLACPVFYERQKVQKELQSVSCFATEAGLYPCCMVEWF